MNKLAGVEAARGVAALLVVLVHASSMFAEAKYFGQMPIGGLFKFGHAGVDFFFVLSGFIIYFIHAGELGDRQYVAAYWAKRFIRLMPVYWVVLAIYGVILVFSPTKDRYEQELTAVLTNILLIPQAHGPILGVSWSLSHEILFYLLFSTLFFNQTIGRLLFLLWGSMIAFNLATHHFQDWFWGGFVFRLFNAEFFFGLFVAYALRTWRPKLPLVFLIMGTFIFLSAGLYESWGPPQPSEWLPRHFAYASGAAMVLYGLVGLESEGRLRVPALASTLGEASYSIYLVHVIVIMVMQQLYLLAQKWIKLPDTLVFITVVVIATTVGIVFSKLIEQPMLKRLRHQFVRKRNLSPA